MILYASGFHSTQTSTMENNPHSYMIVFAFDSPPPAPGPNKNKNKNKNKNNFKTEDNSKIKATRKCSPSFFQFHNK